MSTEPKHPPSHKVPLRVQLSGTTPLLRQYLRKNADLRSFSQDDLEMIAARLNDRPRRVLDQDSPRQREEQVLGSYAVGQQSRASRVVGMMVGMAATGLPELDVARVVKYCASKVPDHLRHEIRVECDIAPRHVTICECRPPQRQDLGPEWTRFPITRLHFTKKTGLWTLYWRDRDLKFHRYQFLAPSPHVQELLDHIDSSGDPIFWG